VPVNRSIVQLVERIGRATSYVPVARKLGVPLWHLGQRRVRSALKALPWELIPAELIRELRFVCDVGANRGDFSAAVLLVAPSARVAAVEPNPAELAVLQRRFAKEPRISLHGQAAGSAPGKATLHVESQSELSSLRQLSARARRFHGASPLAAREVDVVRLDDLLAHEPEISLLKVDVQGFEHDVLDGAQRTLERSVCLVIEVNYEPNYYEGASGFRELYNRIESQSPLRLSCVSAPALAPDGFGAWADAVFVHERAWPR
jgi:FkbM family methyltransferase